MGRPNLNLTKEEKRLRRNELQKVRRANRSDEQLAIDRENGNRYSKAYYDKNKKEVIIKAKAYRQSNKERISTQKKDYYKSNKEEILIQNKARYESHRLPNDMYIVYCLPNEEIPYCGMTSNPHYRMRNHRKMGRDTNDWFILQVCSSEKEARKVERQYHDLGYGGINQWDIRGKQVA
tara:strand:+ start:2149 stop:2682 length:534 start_codon:yes stop_codon:yes gene_type:complete